LNSASNILRCFLVMFPVQVDSTYAVSVEIRPAHPNSRVAGFGCSSSLSHSWERARVRVEFLHP
jgi:hypothetical protein